MPPPPFSSNQFNIYPPLAKPLKKVRVDRNLVAESHTYDLFEESKRFRQIKKFDLVIVQTGGSDVNKPTNIGEFDCPKCLLVGDTHHTSDHPISVVIEYINRNEFDALVSLYNKDHIKWIKALCNTETRFGWFPGLTVQDIRRDLIKDRIPRIFFAGSWRRAHPRRKRLIQAMLSDKLPVEHHQLTRLGTAVFHSNSAISFNCSLNGDFNMRIYECLAASGFLLTDRLSDLSGLYDHLNENEDIVTYGCYEELADKAKYYLADPRKALKIAISGHNKYVHNFAAEKVTNRFLSWVFGDDLEQEINQYSLSDIAGVSIERRLQLYELILMLCLHNESIDLLLVGPGARRVESDLCVFNRCKVFALNQKPEAVNASREGKVLDAREIEKWPWSLVICDDTSELKKARLLQNFENIFELSSLC